MNDILNLPQNNLEEAPKTLESRSLRRWSL